MGNMVKKTADVLEFGSEDWWYKRVLDTGSDLATPDTWHEGVNRVSSKIGFTTPSNAVNGESGQPLTFVDAASIYPLELTSAQSGADFIKFMQIEVKLYKFAIFVSLGKDADGKMLEVFYPIVKIPASLMIDTPGRRPNIVINPILNKSSVTPATVPSGATGIAASFATPARQVLAFAETAT